MTSCMGYLYPAFPHEPMKNHAGHGTDGITTLDYFVAAALMATPMIDRDGAEGTIPDRAAYAVSLALATLAEIDRRLEESRVADLAAGLMEDIGCVQPSNMFPKKGDT